MTAPEIKKLHNNETPPCQIARNTMVQEAKATPMETETADNTQAEDQVKESLQEQEKLSEEGSIATTPGTAES